MSRFAKVNGTLDGGEGAGMLELSDGTIYKGHLFGATGKSVSGECVFQTGMCF